MGSILFIILPTWEETIFNRIVFLYQVIASEGAKIFIPHRSIKILDQGPLTQMESVAGLNKVVASSQLTCLEEKGKNIRKKHIGKLDFPMLLPM